MSQRRPSKLTDAAGLTRRRRRPPRIDPASVSARRRAGQIVIAGTTALIAVATVLGYTTDEPDVALPLPAAQIPLGSTGPESPAGTDGPSSPGTDGPSSARPDAGPSGSLPAPSDGASAAGAPRPAPTSVPPGRSAPPPQTEPPGPTGPPPAKTAPPPPATPRIVGPASLAGFDNFLDDYCEEQGFRGALLLNGRRTPTTGRWVCARFTRLDTIDLDDACQDTFGATARARAQDDGDIRTVRCFDSP